VKRKRNKKKEVGGSIIYGLNYIKDENFLFRFISSGCEMRENFKATEAKEQQKY